MGFGQFLPKNFTSSKHNYFCLPQTGQPDLETVFGREPIEVQMAKQ
jgi:hypothetical protein